jgi:DNA polymerase-3 subunit delta
MQLAPAQLTQHLQRGLRPLYTLHGDEPLLVQEAADAIRAAARTQGYTERTVHTVAGAHFDWSAVLATGGSLSLFADKQIVEIRIPSGKPGKDGSVALQQIAEAAQGNDSTLTLVMLPRLDFQTRKSALVAAPENAGVAMELQPTEQCLAAVDRPAPSANGQRVIGAGGPAHPVARRPGGGNSLAAHQEIQKLAAASARRTAPRQVEAAVLNVARYDVFKLPRGGAGRPWGGSSRTACRPKARRSRCTPRPRTSAPASEGRWRVPAAHGAAEQRVSGVEKLYERVPPRLSTTAQENLLHGAHVVDGIVKGLKALCWPTDGAGPATACHRPVLRRFHSDRPGGGDNGSMNALNAEHMQPGAAASGGLCPHAAATAAEKSQHCARWPASVARQREAP